MAKTKRQKSGQHSETKHGHLEAGHKTTEPRERSDEEAIGRPVQLDENQPVRRQSQSGQTEDEPSEEQARSER